MFSLYFPPISTFRIQTDFLMNFLNDSAWFCVEKNFFMAQSGVASAAVGDVTPAAEQRILNAVGEPQSHGEDQAHEIKCIWTECSES